MWPLNYFVEYILCRIKNSTFLLQILFQKGKEFAINICVAINTDITHVCNMRKKCNICNIKSLQRPR